MHGPSASGVGSLRCRARCAISPGAALDLVPPKWWDRAFERADPLLPKSLRVRTPGTKIQKVARVLDASDLLETYRRLSSHLDDPSRLVLGATEPETLITSPSEWPELDEVELMLYLDSMTYLPDDILTKVDRATMGASLENRVPFLDPNVAALAWRLPFDLKVKNGTGKWLLRQLLYRYVPPEIVDRPKMGFGIPLGGWLRGPLRPWAEDLISKDRLRRRGVPVPRTDKTDVDRAPFGASGPPVRAVGRPDVPSLVDRTRYESDQELVSRLARCRSTGGPNLESSGAGAEGPRKGRRSGLLLAAEVLGVLASPIISFVALRVRSMAEPNLPDPAMHTIYIVDPRDLFVRYSTAYASDARLRESARVGFLVPARIAYLVFGAVPGFFATRYLFALIAVVPAYVLLRRLYSPAAGVVGILVFMSSPVVLTAWGTDYPDSAVVSYMAGALACLAMPSGKSERRFWIAGASLLLTCAVWAHSVAVPLVAATLVVYVGVRLARSRDHLPANILLMGGVALVVTAALSLASGILFGRYNFITTTWDAFRFLGSPAQVASWHAKGWRWVTYLPYLLVPPAVFIAFMVVFARKLRTIPTATLMVGLACGAQIVVFAYLQFFGTVETLEEHYFSSTLWGSVCLAMAFVLVEVSRPIFGLSRWAGWLVVAVVVAVPLVYEAAPREPPYLWVGVGLGLAGVFVAGAVIARLGSKSVSRVLILSSVAVGLVAMLGSCLYLSADPVLRDPYLNWTKDPAPPYFGALGSGAGNLVDNYRIAAEIPGFVGNATYKGEQLLMWWPASEVVALDDLVGMYHFSFNTLPSAPPDLTDRDVSMLQARRPAELLLLDTSDIGPTDAITALSRFDPVLLRQTVLRSGDAVVYAWLINLREFGTAR